MATKHSNESPPVPQTPEVLDGLAERLFEHATNIRNPAAKPMAEDLRRAARVIAEWQVGIEEVIAQTKEDDTRTRLKKLVGGA
jgi:hypothetical protein